MEAVLGLHHTAYLAGLERPGGAVELADEGALGARRQIPAVRLGVVGAVLGRELAEIAPLRLGQHLLGERLRLGGIRRGGTLSLDENVLEEPQGAGGIDAVGGRRRHRWAAREDRG